LPAPVCSNALILLALMRMLSAPKPASNPTGGFVINGEAAHDNPHNHRLADSRKNPVRN
jgi:hypothetical protein